MPEGDNPTQPLKVFLSYTQADVSKVEELYQRLKQDGVDPWFDQKDLLPGQDWEAETRKALANANTALVLLSNNSFTGNDRDQAQLNMVLDRPPNKLFLIPAKLEETEVPERLRAYVAANLYKKGGYQRLLKALPHSSQASGTSPAEVIEEPKREPQENGEISPAEEKNPIQTSLIKSTIAVPMLEKIEKSGGDTAHHKVVIVLNNKYPGGRKAAREQAVNLIEKAIAEKGTSKDQGIDNPEIDVGGDYLYAHLEGAVIQELVRQDKAAPASAVYRVWPDFEVSTMTSRSCRTIKVDAARLSFSTTGKDIVWAVVDSGIDITHPHFTDFGNLLKLPGGVDHQDFTGNKTPTVDQAGHGTHVAGIIAGEMPKNGNVLIYTEELDENGKPSLTSANPPGEEIYSGMAPMCKLVSLRVLVGDKDGYNSNIIQALQYIQMVNDYGRNLLIHGVNISLGYPFYPTWFACGQSPLCVEVDRLVKSGVVVVVAAGNTGNTSSGQFVTRSAFSEGLNLTINDPGNAELAVTVGSTHRDKPYRYGVSFFSSKGPTGDGRMKPDLIAPGEKIISCAAGARKERAKQNTNKECHYMEDSGTSMSAAHVSGAIAAFLSARPEFIGQPEVVKQIFLNSASDLKRDRNFQGHGLIDLMRTIQSV